MYPQSQAARLEVHICVFLTIISVWGVFISPARGAIIGIEARISTSVQELIGGQAASISNDTDEFDSVALNFPLSAISGLISTDLGGSVDSMGRGTGELADPRIATQSNPEEFGLEVACFSNANDVAYLASGSGQESRTLVFSSSQQVDPLPIDFDANGARVIESEVFFSGAMLLWTTDPQVPLDDILGELHFAVTRNGEQTPLFEVALLLDGLSIDQPAPVAVGPIVFDVGGVELLTAGADADTVAALEELDQAAQVVVVLIPFQSHTYQYEAIENDQFVLTGEFDARVRNVPGGTGLAAAWGRRFESLDTLIEQALPQVSGSVIQASVNAKIQQADIGDGAYETPRRSNLFCGALGMVPAMMMLAGIGLMRLPHQLRRLKRNT